MKEVCKLIGVSSRGRRSVLVERLLNGGSPPTRAAERQRELAFGPAETDPPETEAPPAAAPQTLAATKKPAKGSQRTEESANGNGATLSFETQRWAAAGRITPWAMAQDASAATAGGPR